MSMKRKYQHDLALWYHSDKRKPLIIRGARQVGKSTLVRNFAADNSLKLFEINLEKAIRLEKIFATLSVHDILFELELLCNQGPVSTEGTLLFLDEIQATPSALAALRYLYEEKPDLAIIAAGSLLEFALADHSFSMPVGRVEYLHIGPVTFFEFLSAHNEDQLISYLKSYQLSAGFSSGAHEKSLIFLREYLLCGGMPEATAAFIQNRDVEEVVRIHERIAETFRDDFGTYASGVRLARLQRVFDFLPTSIGNKFKYTQIDRDAKAADIREAFDLLAKARVVMPAYHTSCAGIPIDGLRDEKVYKPYALDIGLSNTMRGIRGVTIEEFTSTQFINEGAMAEQFVAQHLQFVQGPFFRPSLFYWLRELRTSNAEVDFVIQSGTRIIPIEVKSGNSGSLKSLQQVVADRNLNLAIRFDLNPPSKQEVAVSLTSNGKSVAFTLVSLPIYMVEQVLEIVTMV